MSCTAKSSLPQSQETLSAPVLDQATTISQWTSPFRRSVETRTSCCQTAGFNGLVCTKKYLNLAISTGPTDLGIFAGAKALAGSEYNRRDYLLVIPLRKGEIIARRRNHPAIIVDAAERNLRFTDAHAHRRLTAMIQLMQDARPSVR